MDDFFREMQAQHPVATAVGNFGGLVLDVALIRFGMQRGGLWLLGTAFGMYDAVRRLNEMGAPRLVLCGSCAAAARAPAPSAPDAPPAPVDTETPPPPMAVQGHDPAPETT